MEGMRRDAAVSYTTPAIFLQLEQDYKAQKKRVNSSKRSSGKKRVHPAREPATDDDEGSSGSDTAVQEVGDEDDEVDQLASSDLEDAATADEPHKRKKSKSGGNGKAAKESKGTKAKERFSKLPKEMLVEIFSYLNPGTLLALSRTNKRLRTLLVAASSRKLWVAARKKDGLPKLVASELSEAAYAELACGKRCQICGKAALRMPDCFLRVRWCKACKADRLVKLDTLAKTHPELHFATPLCVLRSQQTPTQPTHLALLAHWAPLSALEAHDDDLWALQEKDDQTNELSIAMAFASKKELGAGGGVSKSRRAHEEDDDDEGVDGADDSGVGMYEYAGLGRKEGEMGKKVGRYAKRMRALLDPIEEEGKKLFTAIKKLIDEEEHDPAHKKKKKADDAYLPSDRRTELQRRILDLGDGFGEDDFATDIWLKSRLVNEGDDDIDDEAFGALKLKLLKILANAKAKRTSETYKTSQLDRQRALRPLFDQHRANRTFFPLFADYLLLPSVAALWQSKDGVVDEASFPAATGAIDADVNEWVVEARLAAIMLILVRTLEIPPDEELDSDADSYADYDDDWFALISSCLVCPLKGCYQPASHTGKPARATFYGTLADLFAHQHAVHADTLDLPAPIKLPKQNGDGGKKAATPATKSKKKAAAPSTPPPQLYHFDLPLEVASAVDALTDVLTKDIKAMRRRDRDRERDESSSASSDVDEDDVAFAEEDEPTIAEVDRLFEEKKGLKLRWWDGMKAKGKGEREWRKVICHVKREAEKAARAKPPRVILPALGFDPVP
ncbi:hypothetical protein JCM6882_003620 [Rhodosporidiobolus microsporus]